MATIFNITGELLQLLEMMQDETVDKEVLTDTFESVNMEFEDKADGYANVIASLNADSKALKEEIDRLKERKDSIDRNIKNVKEVLEMAMRAIEKPKFKTLTHTFFIGKNTPSVQIVDGAAVPEEFLIRKEPDVDKKGVAAYLKANGPTDWAVLVQSEGLKIR